MADDLTKRAADLLLKGATLVGEPCPYCRGVRVLKDGDALCISCGRSPQKGGGPEERPPSVLQTLEKKLEDLSRELAAEADHGRQREIIASMDSLADAIAKLKGIQ